MQDTMVASRHDAWQTKNQHKHLQSVKKQDQLQMNYECDPWANKNQGYDKSPNEMLRYDLHTSAQHHTNLILRGTDAHATRVAKGTADYRWDAEEYNTKNSIYTHTNARIYNAYISKPRLKGHWTEDTMKVMLTSDTMRITWIMQ